MGRDLFTCSNASCKKACHQGPYLSSSSSISRVEAEMVLANHGIKKVETKTNIEDAITESSTFKVRDLGSISGRLELLNRGEK
jgi:hypothetical protein